MKKKNMKSMDLNIVSRRKLHRRKKLQGILNIDEEEEEEEEDKEDKKDKEDKEEDEEEEEEEEEARGLRKEVVKCKCF